MNFKVLSKNNVGSAFLLLVIILLSQARTFDYFINNYLGRLLLIIAVIILSYINKILGVVLVLFIIMMMNRIDFLYVEGMENRPSGRTNSDSATTDTIDITATETETTNQNIRPEMVAAIAEKVQAHMSENGGGANGGRSGEMASARGQNGSMEGTNLTENEDAIKKGKSSNSIAVDEGVRNSDNVEAFYSFNTRDSNYATI